MRLAWFTPLPPARSGVAAYNAELLPRLARDHAIDVFVDQGECDPGPWRTFSAHDFIWRHARSPYELVVYQLGNATCHAYMWPYVTRYQGLVVLHDAQLHHVRARTLLKACRYDDYRAEFQHNHPAAPADVAEFVIAGLEGPVYYYWPMLRTVIESARLLAVHNGRVAADLEDQCSRTAVMAIRMGVTESTPRSTARSVVRGRHGISPEALVFAAFGRLTPEKRIVQALKGLKSLLPYAPEARFLLVGEPAEYFDVAKIAADLGVADRVTLTGFVADTEIADYLAAADVCLCLRWPTARETSASWLRCLAAGRPTVVTDLAHTVDVPTLDPRTSTILGAGSGARAEPVAISIDILDEEHSLKLALRWLAQDPALRHELSQRGRAYWEQHHTIDLMVEDYRAALARAVTLPRPSLDRLPVHLRADGTALVRRLCGELGVQVDFLKT